MSVDNEPRKDKHYVYRHLLMVFYKKRWINVVNWPVGISNYWDEIFKNSYLPTTYVVQMESYVLTQV